MDEPLQRRELKPTTFRLSVEARELLAALSRHKGISMTSVLEVLLREEAKREGIRPPQDDASG